MDSYNMHSGDVEPDLLFFHTTTSNFPDEDIQKMISVYIDKFQYLCLKSNTVNSPVSKLKIDSIIYGIQLYSGLLNTAIDNSHKIIAEYRKEFKQKEVLETIDKLEVLNLAKEELEAKKAFLNK